MKASPPATDDRKDQTDLEPEECAGYYPVAGGHLYTVLHAVADPVARVLLVGPFASERHNSYVPWTRWARYLAARRIEVLRYDYRGVGESTGVFEQMTLASWLEDVDALSGWLRQRSPETPLLLHGLELGGLLAARSFVHGRAEGLLLWSAPANANLSLRSTLMSWVALQQLSHREYMRKPASHYIRLLEEGQSVEVDGYQWTPELWRDSFTLEVPAAMLEPASAMAAYGRPVQAVTLGKNAAPLVKGGIGGAEEARDFDWLFSANFDWIASVAARSRETV